MNQKNAAIIPVVIIGAALAYTKFEELRMNRTCRKLDKKLAEPLPTLNFDPLFPLH